MKQRLLIIFLFASLTTVQAQELSVKQMSVSDELLASQYPRKDLNGYVCALVKVELTAIGATFEGNVIPPVEQKAGEYWVYLTPGSREVRIKLPNYLPLHVTFIDYGIKGVQSGTTYNLTLSVPKSGELPKQKLIINYSPATAMVTIDSKTYQGNGRLELELPIGTHTYQIAAMGYEAVFGSVKLTANTPRTLSETLVASEAAPDDNADVAKETEGLSPRQICHLAEDYYRSYNGKEKDLSRAFRLYHIAAEQGDGVAQYSLGHFYSWGIIVQKDKDEGQKWIAKALESIRNASKRGDAEATYYLAIMYDSGTGMEERDFKEAWKLYLKSAKAGYHEAQFHVGMAYYVGSPVFKEHDVAFKWFMKAAKQGKMQAQYQVGRMLELGQGTARNLEEARYWYEKAAAQGDTDSARRLQSLGQ